MKHALKTLLIAGAVGAAGLFSAAPASAYDHYRSSARIHVVVGPRYHRTYRGGFFHPVRYRCDRFHRYACRRDAWRGRYRRW